MKKDKIGASTIGPAGLKVKVPPDKLKTNNQKPSKPQQLQPSEPTANKRKKSTPTTKANKKPSISDNRWSRATCQNPDADLSLCESDASGIISEAESEDLFASNHSNQLFIMTSTSTGTINNLPSTSHCEQELNQNKHLSSTSSTIYNLPSTTYCEQELNQDKQNRDLNNNDESSPSLLNANKMNPPKNSARIDLTKLDLEDIPKNTNQIIISTTAQSPKITSCNPIKIKKAIDALCGEIQELEYLRSGNLLITVKNQQQLKTILKATILPILNIQITSAIAWARHFTYGKIYAPELSHESLPELLDMLSPFNVVSIRKLFSDPRKSHVPLYVLTFMGPTPSSLKLGYISYQVDTYYPSPTQCRKCWRLRHPTKDCRSQETCSNCSSTEHKAENCSANPTCINCKGPHPSISQQCPMYQKEKLVCTLKADKNISYVQARSEAEMQNISSSFQNSPNMQTSNEPASIIGPTPSQSNQPPTSSARHHGSNINMVNLADFPRLPSLHSNISPIPPTPSNHTYANIAQSSSQKHVEQYVLPQQRQQLRVTAAQNVTQDEHNELPPSLPFQGSLSQHYFPEPTQRCNGNENLPRLETSLMSSLSCNCPKEKSSNLNLQELLPKLFPLLIKLILSNNITDKIETLTLIGQLFQLDEIVSTSLNDFHLPTINKNGS